MERYFEDLEHEQTRIHAIGHGRIRLMSVGKKELSRLLFKEELPMETDTWLCNPMKEAATPQIQKNTMNSNTFHSGDGEI